MNNLIVAKDYATYGDEGLTSNKVIYYKDDNMVKFKANVSDDPFALPETITINGGKFIYDEETNTLNIVDNYGVEL